MREAIVKEGVVGAGVVGEEDLMRLIRDPALPVRRITVERLVAAVPLERLLPGPLEDRIRKEDDRELWKRMISLVVQAGGGKELLGMAATLPSELAVDIVEHLADAEMRFDWRDLRPLSLSYRDQLNELLAPERLVELLDRTDIIPAIPLLLEMFPHYLVISTLVDARAQFHSEAVAQFDQATIDLLIAALRRDIEELKEAGDDDEWSFVDDEEYWRERIDEREKLLALLTRRADAS